MYLCCANGRDFAVCLPDVKAFRPPPTSIPSVNTASRNDDAREKGMGRFELLYRMGDDGKAGTEGFCVGCRATLLFASVWRNTFRLVLVAQGLSRT